MTLPTRRSDETHDAYLVRLAHYYCERAERIAEQIIENRRALPPFVPEPVIHHMTGRSVGRLFASDTERLRSLQATLDNMEDAEALGRMLDRIEAVEQGEAHRDGVRARARTLSDELTRPVRDTTPR